MGPDERHRWTQTSVLLVLALACCVVAAMVWARSGARLLACVLVFLLAAATLVARRVYEPTRDAGRPVIARIDDGTGQVDAVRFAARTVAVWAYAVALGLWDALAIVATVRRGAAGGVHTVVHWPVAWAALVSTVAIALLVAVGLRTQFVAVTPDGLVLGAGRRRMRIPWDRLSGARAVTLKEELMTQGRYLDRERFRYTRYLALRARPGPAGPGADRVLLRWFGTSDNPFAARALPMIRVDGPLPPSAPRTLIRAIHWHLRAPRTLEALAAGYGQRWPEAPQDA